MIKSGRTGRGVYYSLNPTYKGDIRGHETYNEISKGDFMPAIGEMRVMMHQMAEIVSGKRNVMDPQNGYTVTSRSVSSIKYSKYIVKVSLMLLRDFFWRLKMKYVVFSFHPLVLFYMLGIVLTPIGLFGGLFALYYKYVIGGDLFVRGALSLLVFIIGVQFLLFAMLFDMQVDNSERRSGRWE